MTMKLPALFEERSEVFLKRPHAPCFRRATKDHGVTERLWIPCIFLCFCWIDPYRLSSESYLLDEVKQVKFEVSRDTDRRPVASRNGQPNQYIIIRPKQTIEVWAKYIVPESVNSVTVSIEGVRPFDKIAIAK